MKMIFGKYKGQLIKDVAVKDQSYINWAFENQIPHYGREEIKTFYATLKEYYDDGFEQSTVTWLVTTPFSKMNKWGSRDAMREVTVEWRYSTKQDRTHYKEMGIDVGTTFKVGAVDGADLLLLSGGYLMPIYAFGNPNVGLLSGQRFKNDSNAQVAAGGHLGFWYGTDRYFKTRGMYFADNEWFRDREERAVCGRCVFEVKLIDE